jgi:carbamoyl-phosphate synthase small subunit
LEFFVLLSLVRAGSPAILALADGTVFLGVSIGAPGLTLGEVVFNTAVSGYQEILTDPSYCRQLVTLTYPHIGSYGTNQQDMESSRVQAAGLVIKDLPMRASNFRSQSHLSTYLHQQDVVAIAQIDTRQLTRHLREKGSQNGAILALPALASTEKADLTSAIERACQAAADLPSMSGQDLALEVSCSRPFDWVEGLSGLPLSAEPLFHVVAYDFGVKRSILRMLVQRGCRVTVVPAQTKASEVLRLKPDGVFFSNGPGDPQPCTYAIDAARAFMSQRMPFFGICLGHQIMALACGARTFKMKFGHHGANHPVKDISTGRVSITSQNHGFAVEAASLPANLRATHVSLFDGTVQGLERTDCPAFSFQGHPEAAPGPHDISYLFDRFMGLMGHRHAQTH